MAKVTDLTKDELGICLEGVAQLVASARRQQNAKRGTPQLKAVYEKHEQVCNALELKLREIVNTIK